MDIFQMMEQKNKEKESPLASRLRPKTIDEVVGQEHILGKDKLDTGLRTQIKRFIWNNILNSLKQYKKGIQQA